MSVLIAAFFSDARAERKKTDNWFSSDKYKHFTVSAFYSAGTSIVANKHFDIEESASHTIGFSFTLSLGAAKEIADFHSRDGTASLKDLVWDLAGTLTGILAASLVL
ncbi:MAG: hypothetical protein A2W25_02730 [candidate division Zixibacteria bacterium RBG_16_53_22]|nr:MAG: hypothetical protein A2W25_02730 [candidate division Zixibacteria bacterium RBG_16_53_22]